MQVAVKDVYLKRPISHLSPKLEMNKSSVQFTPTDGLISNGDPDYPNRLECYYVYFSLHMGFHSFAFIATDNSFASQS